MKAHRFLRLWLFLATNAPFSKLQQQWWESPSVRVRQRHAPLKEYVGADATFRIGCVARALHFFSSFRVVRLQQ